MRAAQPLASGAGLAKDAALRQDAAPMPYLWMFFIFCMLGMLALCVMI